MSTAYAERPIYCSFFLFDTTTRLWEPGIEATVVERARALNEIGYAGIELHIGRGPETEVAFPEVKQEVAAYANLRAALDAHGLEHLAVATNVGVSPQGDPSSDDAAVRAAGEAFLRSRVDVAAALRAEILMGPVVIPYGAFVVSGPNGDGVWSDALQDHLARRYANAAPVLQAVGIYAETLGVKIAIEPITHWETPGPNTLEQVLTFLDSVETDRVGVVIDSAHETLDGAGPEVFAEQVQRLTADRRLHYAQASPPDRGRLDRSWLPWGPIFGSILPAYDGPVAIEIFNAVPGFDAGLRLSRRRYRVPGVDAPSDHPDAYAIAKASLDALRREFAALSSELAPTPASSRKG